MEEAWCAFADADTIEEGGRDLNAAMSKIAQAREEPSTHREKAPSPKEEAIRVWNRFLTTQQKLARKHQGLTEARQEDEAKVCREAAVMDWRRRVSNMLEDLPRPREEEAPSPSEEPSSPSEELPDPRKEHPREELPSPRRRHPAPGRSRPTPGRSSTLTRT